MDYCAPRGVRYGEFLDWDQLSRDAALAWQARENARCGSCGQVEADWMVDGPDGPTEAVPPPLVVDHHWCPGCAALGTRRANEKDLPAGVTHAFRANVTDAEAPPATWAG
jgi:hypothetical protein